MRRTFTVSREAGCAGRDDERRRVLRDLHDSVGPTLAAAALGLHSARNLLHSDRAAAERILVRIEEELHTAIADVRRLAREAHPPELDRLGLVGAVRHFAETLASRMPAPAATGGEFRIEVEVCGEFPPLPVAVEVAAYRIVREALTNVSRHSGARSCVVRFRFDGQLRVEIIDDGVGADAPGGAGPDAAGGPGTGGTGGAGLASMRERARGLGGDVVVGPGALAGTRVAATLPVRAG